MRPTLFLLERKSHNKVLISEQLLNDTWLAVKNISRKQLIEKLGLKKTIQINWDAGLLLKNDNFLIPPALDGWTILVGKYFSNKTELLKNCLELSEEFGEVYHFSNWQTQDEISKYHWVYANAGMLEQWDADEFNIRNQMSQLPIDLEKFDYEFKFKNVLLCQKLKNKNQLRLW